MIRPGSDYVTAFLSSMSDYTMILVLIVAQETSASGPDQSRFTSGKRVKNLATKETI